MSLEFPLDVWIHSLPYLHRLEDSKNLSMTCKSLREISLPRIYREFSFGLPNSMPLRDNDIECMKSFFSRICERTQSLQKFPHLCSHVRSVSIHSWVNCAERIHAHKSAASENGDIIGATHNTDLANHLLSLAYESIIALLPQLPRLQQLVISRSEITPALHSYITSHSQLTHLVISGCDIPEETVSRTKSSVSVPIQDMMIDNWRSSAHFESYFPWLIDACHPNLQSLMVSDEHIPLILVAAANRRLILRELSISTETEELSLATARLLASCQELRTLKSYVADEGSDLSSLPDNALPNLEHILGPPRIMRVLVPGRPVRCIDVIDPLPEHEMPQFLDMFQRSKAEIRSISLAYGDEGLEDPLKSMHSLYAFRHLNHLTIFFTSLKEGMPTAKVRIMPKTGYIRLTLGPGNHGWYSKGAAPLA